MIPNDANLRLGRTHPRNLNKKARSSFKSGVRTRKTYALAPSRERTIVPAQSTVFHRGTVATREKFEVIKTI